MRVYNVKVQSVYSSPKLQGVDCMCHCISLESVLIGFGDNTFNN